MELGDTKVKWRTRWKIFETHHTLQSSFTDQIQEAGVATGTLECYLEHVCYLYTRLEWPRVCVYMWLSVHSV